MSEEIEVVIKVWGTEPGTFIEILNGTDENMIFIQTDADKRQIEISINDLKLALKKMVAK